MRRRFAQGSAGEHRSERAIGLRGRQEAWLSSKVVAPTRAYELKRGSPSDAHHSINTDPPVCHIAAQVSRNVYDSATGHQLPIPQAANSNFIQAKQRLPKTARSCRSEAWQALTWTVMV